MIGVPGDEIRGVVEDGKVIAYYLIERGQVHVGPFHVNEDRRGFIGGKLVIDAAEHTPTAGTYIAATTPDAVAMCQRMGLHEIAGKLFAR